MIVEKMMIDSMVGIMAGAVAGSGMKPLISLCLAAIGIYSNICIE